MKKSIVKVGLSRCMSCARIAHEGNHCNLLGSVSPLCIVAFAIATTAYFCGHSPREATVSSQCHLDVQCVVAEAQVLRHVQVASES